MLPQQTHSALGRSHAFATCRIVGWGNSFPTEPAFSPLIPPLSQDGSLAALQVEKEEEEVEEEEEEEEQKTEEEGL